MAQLVTEGPSEATSRGPTDSGTGEPLLPTCFLLTLRSGVAWDSCCHLLCSTHPDALEQAGLPVAGKGVATGTPATLRAGGPASRGFAP